MSPAEALRFCREFKNLKEAAGIPPYDPRDRDAIRRGFFGDFYDSPLDTIDRSRGRSRRQPIRPRPGACPRRRLTNQETPARRASHISADAAMSKATELLGRFQDKRKRRLLVLANRRHMDREVAYEVDRMLLQMGDVGSLDVVLDSGGGDLDAAYKVLKTIKSRATDATAVVPFCARGAAALIALGADSLAVCKGGDLGPVDPQVLDTCTGRYVQASLIKETMDFLEGLRDPAVKAAMTDKIPMLMAGEYGASAKASRQYLAEVLADRDIPNAEALVGMFAEGFLSHGCPMDAEFLRKHGINVSDIGSKAELMAHDLLDCYAEAERASDGGGGVTVIHSDAGHTMIRGGGGSERSIYKSEPKGRP